MVPEVVIVGIDGSVVRFREVVGFNRYLIGDDGSLWSSLVGKQNPSGDWWNVGGSATPLGYRRFALSCSGKQVSRFAHRLVLEAFVGPCPEGMEGCHKDRNPANNRLDNLRWGTPKSNQADKRRHGTVAAGERHGSAKLSPEEVREIRRLYATACFSSRQLAKRFKVSQHQILMVIWRKHWAHVV